MLKRYLMIFILLLIFLNISSAFILYSLPEESLINFTLTFEIESMESKGKVTVVTNKFPKNMQFQEVYSPLSSTYEFNLSGRIRKSYSSLVKLRTGFQKLYEKVSYHRLFSYTNNEYVCFDKICDSASNVLLYLVKDLVEDDLFKTVCKINHFVNSFITYDLFYSSDQNPTIKTILSVRRGVCIHYATLMSEILNALGIENKIVFGYAKSSVNATNWEAHAWVRVKIGKEYFFFDPTFDICAMNDVLHLYMDDESLYSSISYFGIKRDIYFADYIDIKEIKNYGQFSPNISISFKISPEEIHYNESTTVLINVKNNEDFYVYLSIKLISAEKINFSSDEFFLVLSPKEEITIFSEVKHDYKDSRYEYMIPISLFSSWSYEETKFFKIKDVKNSKIKNEKETTKVKSYSSLEHRKSFEIYCLNHTLYRGNRFERVKYLREFDCYIKNNGPPFSTQLSIKNSANQSFTHQEFLLLSTKEIYYINLSKFVSFGSNRLIIEVENQSTEVIINVFPLNYSFEQTSKEIWFSDHQKESKLIEVYAQDVLISQHFLDERNYSSMVIIKKSDISKRLMHHNNKTVKLKILVKFKSYEYIVEEEIMIELKTMDKIKFLFKNILQAIFHIFS